MRLETTMERNIGFLFPPIGPLIESLKKYWDLRWKVSKERMGPLLGSFKIINGKFQKNEWDVRCKVSKEGMGPSIEIFKRKNGTFDGKFQKNEWELSSLEIALAVIDFLEFSHAK